MGMGSAGGVCIPGGSFPPRDPAGDDPRASACGSGCGSRGTTCVSAVGADDEDVVVFGDDINDETACDEDPPVAGMASPSAVPADEEIDCKVDCRTSLDAEDAICSSFLYLQPLSGYG